MAEDFGDFEEEGNSENTTNVAVDGISMPVRVRMPRKGEIIGMVVQRLGGNRMEVQCTDGKTRNCRVPGRFKRSMWLKLKNIVLVEPWEFDNTKADIIFNYNPGATNQLRKRGLLDNLKSEF